MKEHPIFMSAPMVRALIDGKKTQTRRAMRNQVCPPGIVQMAGPGHCEILNEHGVHIPGFRCPYGQPGDRLWVRETWAEVGGSDPGLIIYRADYPACVPAGHENILPADAITWKPSIHMFRRYSRLLLEAVSVRVERLQDISEADAIAEGIEPNWIGDLRVGPNGFGGQGWVPDCGWTHYTNSIDGDPAYTPIESYRSLWESINGADSWTANPWVWVIEFRRQQ